MALAILLSFFLGGMPMCQGAGGLASRYRFGARTAGSNLMIGTLFIALAVFLGSGAVALLYLLPLCVLGILLIFAGAQLALALLDMQSRKELFIPLMIVGITLASNLAAGFMVGIALAYLIKWDRLTI
jgi:SulP family sulfate permease